MNSLIFTLLISIAVPSYEAHNLLFETSDIFNTDQNVTGAFNLIPSNMPSPQIVFESGKQLLAGYPFEVLSTAIHQICSAAISSDVIKPRITPDINNMSFLLMTPSKNYTYRLLDADDMWKNPAFNNQKKTVIFVTGWTTDLEGTHNEPIASLSKAYFCQGDTNFVVVDSARYLDTLYTWAALNTEAIGEYVAQGLVELIKYVPVKNIHLIGHSLGAHIVGAAGREFNLNTGEKIPRITGLDPAKPCFNEGEKLSGLQRGDAAFIDVIHSNPGVVGKREPIGDVDFYPGGLAPLAPGCYSVPCAHHRAWQYYAETTYPGNEHNFKGVRCSSLTRLRQGKCTGNAFPMGYAVPQNLRGNYFLEVNSESPFGKDAPSANTMECNGNSI